MSRIKVKIVDTESQVGIEVASRIVGIAKSKPNPVFCLATGSSPIPTYKELIKAHQQGGVDFSHARTFNLDEYYPLDRSHSESYYTFMHEQLFSKLNIPEQNITIPRGDLPKEQYESYCAEMERKIEESGGFDLCLLGIGKTGHIAFNEPGSRMTDMTRLVVLHHQTRKDNSRFFNSLEAVPKYAVTLGIGTILKHAKKIILIATKFAKAQIIRACLEDNSVFPDTCPAKYLLNHPDCEFILDEQAASLLRHVKSPWEVLTGTQLISFEWTPSRKHQAVIWLSNLLNKPILSLSEGDFCDNNLSSLFYEEGSKIDGLLEKVYGDLMKRVHSKDNPILPIGEKDRVIVFSPHPGDADIAMGSSIMEMARHLARPGSASRLTVASLVSGSRGVSKSDLQRHIRFMDSCLSLFSSSPAIAEGMKKLKDEVEKVQDFMHDPPLVQIAKANVRKAESLNALEVFGLDDSSCVFLDLPFYQSGADAKHPVTESDVACVVKLMNEKRPTHVFVCYDLDTPHSTNLACYHLIRNALAKFEAESKQTVHKILYKGAWQEFSPAVSSLFVPFTHNQLQAKIDAIIRHASQKESRLFPGDDHRQFWERAKDRNIQTAAELRVLGLPCYHAVESLKEVLSLPAEVRADSALPSPSMSGL